MLSYSRPVRLRASHASHDANRACSPTLAARVANVRATYCNKPVDQDQLIKWLEQAMLAEQGS